MYGEATRSRTKAHVIWELSSSLNTVGLLFKGDVMNDLNFELISESFKYDLGIC